MSADEPRPAGLPAGRAARMVATTLGGVGLAPWAPGTWGTLATVPLAFALWATRWPLAMLVGAVVTTAVGVMAAGAVARASGTRDPSSVVIDEAAGYLLACSFAPAGWLTAVVAFGLFRLLDITKPGPIKRLERLPGGWGIMADDVAAGLLAGAVTWLAFGIARGQWGGAFAP